MCPGRTTSPLPFFNPRNFGFESRPLLELPPCFFDANLAKSAFTAGFQIPHPARSSLAHVRVSALAIPPRTALRSIQTFVAATQHRRTDDTHTHALRSCFDTARRKRTPRLRRLAFFANARTDVVAVCGKSSRTHTEREKRGSQENGSPYEIDGSQFITMGTEIPA